MVLVDEIKKYLLPNTTHLLTTRLDNDDALNKNFVYHLQANVNQEIEDCFINFKNGNQYDMVNNALNKCTIYSNPFISRVEDISIKKDNFKTVSCLRTHNHAISSGIPYFDMNMPNMWLQVIHQKNLENNFYIRSVPVISNNLIKENFSINYPIKLSLFSTLKTYIQIVYKKILKYITNNPRQNSA